MPEHALEKIKKSILPQWKICFVCAFIFGLITHLYKITNWLPNWDSLVFRYDSQNMLAMGRWFLAVVCAPSSFYDLPLLSGLISIVFHALGAVCICNIFNVKKNITAALIGAFIVSFPTVTSVMMYNYVADGYSVAFFLSCLAAMLLLKEKPHYKAAVILITLSVGIYQAYITVTIALILLYLIIELIYGNIEFKKFISKTIRFALTGILGMILYYLIFTVLLKITKTEVLEYQGFGTATSLSGLNLSGSIFNIKHYFVNYFFDFSGGISFFSVLNIVIFVITATLYVIDIIKNKLSISKISLLILFVALLPIGTTVLCFVNSGIDYHNLMKMGYIAFYLLLILQYEKEEFNCAKLNSVKMWTILCVIFALISNYVVIANISYHKLNMAYENSYGTLIRMADRIEQTEGADKCDSILVIGQLPGSEAYSTVLPPDITGTTDGSILRADDEIVGQSVICSALNDYCNKDFKFVFGNEKTKLLKKIDTQSLSNWPAKNSVSVIDNVIIIKLSDERK